MMFAQCIEDRKKEREKKSFKGFDLFVEALEECLKMLTLEFEEVNLVPPLGPLKSRPFGLTPLDRFALISQFDDFGFQLLFLGFEVHDHAFGLRLALFGLELLAGAECHRRLVQSLVGGDGHPNFVANP